MAAVAPVPARMPSRRPVLADLHAGFYPFIIGGIVKAAIAGVLLPAAWKLVRVAE